MSKKERIDIIMEKHVKRFMEEDRKDKQLLTAKNNEASLSGSSVKEIVREGYKYLDMGGMIIPILDEYGNHEKFEEIH